MSLVNKFSQRFTFVCYFRFLDCLCIRTFYCFRCIFSTGIRATTQENNTGNRRSKIVRFIVLSSVLNDDRSNICNNICRTAANILKAARAIRHSDKCNVVSIKYINIPIICDILQFTAILIRCQN